VFSQIGLPSFPGVSIACKSDLMKVGRGKYPESNVSAPTCAVFLKRIKALPKVTEINRDIEFLSTSTI